MDVASIAALADSAAGAAAFNAHAWPSSLRSLEISATDTVSLGLQRVINALPSSAPALQSLTLLQNAAQMDLTPLLQLRELTRLVARLLNPSQLAVVKQLSGLTDVSIADGWWSAESLRALLVDGSHQLQRLQRINLKEVDLDVGTVQSLETLTSLTELAPRTVHPSCFPSLRSLCNPRKLCMQLRRFRSKRRGGTIGMAPSAFESDQL